MIHLHGFWIVALPRVKVAPEQQGLDEEPLISFEGGVRELRDDLLEEAFRLIELSPLSVYSDDPEFGVEGHLEMAIGMSLDEAREVFGSSVTPHSRQTLHVQEEFSQIVLRKGEPLRISPDDFRDDWRNRHERLFSEGGNSHEVRGAYEQCDDTSGSHHGWGSPVNRATMTDQCACPCSDPCSWRLLPSPPCRERFSLRASW
jgi:hypothetical protein